ncbi:MAG: hypothetical protein ACYDH5_04335 [Acidimicrobiales bacterium]
MTAIRGRARELWDAVQDPSNKVEWVLCRFFDGLLIVGSLLVAALFIAFSAGAKGPGPAHGVGVTLAAAVLWMTFHVIARLDTVGSRWDRTVVFFRFWTMTGLLFGGGITLAETVGLAAPSAPVGYATEVTVGIALLAALARAVGRRRTLARDVARLLKHVADERHPLDHDGWELLQEHLAAAWLWKSGASFMTPDVATTWCLAAQSDGTPTSWQEDTKRLLLWATRMAGQGSP